MPTYDYKCTKCGHVFEAFQHITDKPLTRCPECKGAIRRMVGGGMAVIFKGSGFYSTDNKKSSALAGGNGGSKDGGSKDGGSKDGGSKDGGSKEKDNGGSKEKPVEKAKTASSESSTSTTEKKAAS